MADYINISEDKRGLVSIKNFYVGSVDDPEMTQLTVKEIVMGESILTPGLQTVVTFQNSIYIPSGKNFDKFKNQPLIFSLQRDAIMSNGRVENFTLACANQTVYRMDNRGFKPTNVSETEEFSIHACHPTLLTDARELVSKSWKCVPPTSIVYDMFTHCLGLSPSQFTISNSGQQGRDYIAENIHPFQVINQQSNVALFNGNPDYVHFMTYSWNSGDDQKHHFRSIQDLCNQNPVGTFYYGDADTGLQNNPAYGAYANPQAVLSMEFPCDFDLLSDALNGIDENGNDRNTLSIVNLASSLFDSSGSRTGCGIGQYNYKVAVSNKSSKGRQDSCNLDVETHLLKRQARMALLDRDKIALRMVVPWNPYLHAGTTVDLLWPNKYDNNAAVYGQGRYLITAMTHNIRMGGYSTTTVDCVTNTAGMGLTGRA